MKKIIATFGLCVFAVCLLTSCLDDNDDLVLSNKVVITAFSINDFGKINGALYPFSIDHVGNRIYNRDSLPVGTDVSKVSVNVSFDGGAIFYTVGGEERAYSTTDSIDFTSPVIFSVYAADGSWRRNYAVSVNVHTTDMDSLVWNKVENEDFKGLGMKVGKTVLINDKLLVFGEKEGLPVVLNGSLSNGINFVFPETPLNGITGTVDYSSIVSLDNVLYLLADGKLYNSTDAVEWTNLSSEHTFVSMAGVIDGRLHLCEESNYDDSLSLMVLKTGQMGESAGGWEKVQHVSKNDFPYSPSVVTVPLATNSSITRTTLVGISKDNADNEVKVWVKLSTENKLTHYGKIAENEKTCPVLERLTVISYNESLYAFGGKNESKGLEAFESIYVSEDGGITWKKQNEHIGLPDELKGYDESYACVVDDDKNIWLLCSDGRMFRGKIPGLAQ